MDTKGVGEEMKVNQDAYREIPDELRRDIQAALGEIRYAVCEAPGIYYMCVEGQGEIYVVEDTSQVVSDTAKQSGARMDALPNRLLFSFTQNYGSIKVIDYELEKWRVLSRIPGHDRTTLHEVAVYAAEHAPEYFGSYPAPILTPWGYTLRYLVMGNGIIWSETDLCKCGLALCYPIWNTELSEYARTLGAETQHDGDDRTGNTFGCLFFEEADACVPIFELLKTHRDWLSSGMVEISALMNAIWRYHPEYVIANNAREQLGVNDWIRRMLSEFGVDAGPGKSMDGIISLNADAGERYLRF